MKIKKTRQEKITELSPETPPFIVFKEKIPYPHIQPPRFQWIEDIKISIINKYHKIH